MHRFFESLRPFIRGVVRRAGLVLGLALLVSAGSLYLAKDLRIDTDFANLLPDDYPSVQALERLRQTVGGETTVDVAIQSPSFAANRAFAETLIPEALALQGEGRSEPYLARVEYRRDTDFLKKNALYFATFDELDSLDAYLDEKVEEAKLEANPFFFELEDEDLEEEADEGETLLASYNDIVGSEYLVSDDSTVLVVRFFPAGAQTNIQYSDDLYRDLGALVDRLDPASFDPAMEVTLAGRLYRQVVEVHAITDDVRGSFGVGVSAVLLVVVLYFFYKAVRARSGGGFDGRVALRELARTPVLALVIGLPLLMSLSWTGGMAALTFGELNLMTSTLGLVLFGLGIDYGIHFYARYSEERGRGLSVVDAIEKTFTSTGQAITVGALTTVAALYVLVVADFKGFSEFGAIAGTGVLFALVAMTVVMPALLALLERFRLLNLEAAEAGPTGLKGMGERFPGARGAVLASLAVVVAALVLLPRVDFEYEFGNLEPEYEAWKERNRVVRMAYSDSNNRNPAYIVLDDPGEAEPVVAAVRERMAQDTTVFVVAEGDTFYTTIDRVESLQDRFPTTPAAQQRKLARIAEVRERLDDPFIQAESSEEIDKLRQAAQTTDPITLEEVPNFLKKQFASKSGEVGNFIIIYPEPDLTLSDARNSIRFSDAVGTITTDDGREYHAGSTSLVAADMIRLMQAEAPWMVLATFVMVMLLMWINFGSFRWALLALLPLFVGILWMLLLMEIFDLKLNFYNLVVLPAVLGIGNDAGAHLVHRYREEGFGSIRAILRSTGEHVTMSAFTTMVGFGGLLLSFHPGLRSIGLLAVVGIGATLLAALVFLPAYLQWREDRLAKQTAKDMA